MEINGTYLLPCSRQRAWDALNDPAFLKSSLKGCEDLQKLSDTHYSGTVATRIGPVSARFSGTMRLENLNAPESCDMVFEGQGGVAGFARGSARVTLAPEGFGTRLSYTADTKIGGKIAQMGTRLVEGTARSLADDFFGRFSELVAEGEAAPALAGAAPELAPSGQRRTLWLLLGAALVAAALFAFLS